MCRWVEFAHKSDAKRIAVMLNGEPMGMSSTFLLFFDFGAATASSTQRPVC